MPTGCPDYERKIISATVSITTRRIARDTTLDPLCDSLANAV